MKRRESSVSGAMTSNKLAAEGNLSGEPIRAPVVVLDVSSTEVRPGVVLVDGCEAGESKKALARKRLGVMPRIAELTVDEPKRGDKRQDGDVNDIFPDEILLHIMKYNWRPENCWEMARVCKRWSILQAYNQLQKRINKGYSSYSCMGVKRAVKRVDKKIRVVSPCESTSRMLKMDKVDSEWRLAMDLMGACQRHTHALEIKDCTHLSMRGYQLISGFASNLRSIRLEACNSMDDISFDTILDKCPRLRSLHLGFVPKLSFKDVETKSFKLQELQLYGCRFMTGNSVLALLTSCPTLKTLSLSGMGVSDDWDECKIGQGPPLRLQSLELANTLAVTDGFLRGLGGRLSNLRKLNISSCALVSDDGFKAIIASCGSRLQKLVVTRCPLISDDSVHALAGVAANLQDLSLAGTDMSDDGVQALMASKAILSKLRTLSLACCQRLTDAGLEHIVSRHKELLSFKSLDVQSCTEVSPIALETLNGKFYKRTIYK